MIFANLPCAYANGADLEAREAMGVAAFYAGLAFTKAYVGYVHAFLAQDWRYLRRAARLANAITLPLRARLPEDAPYARGRLADLALAIGAGERQRRSPRSQTASLRACAS
jgi:alcohol dehydrogenase class IV